MTQIIDKPKDRRFVHSGLSWKQFKSIQSGFSGFPSIRLFYYQGTLELASTSPEREIFKSIIGYLVETFFLEQGMRIIPTGSMTQEREAVASVQADESYCFGESKPIPDLSIEIVFSSGGESKLERYQALGVPEVWFWEDGVFALYHLRESGYERITQSEFASGLDFALLTRCVVSADLTDAVREFRRGMAQD
ncbi:Uma2 family endonuclease [Lusitaniella coriacea LEGE 07157]|uniref:Uma2 family endonuclease n=1 Tax=Lusitaniella coriacea LEGE 07157 TaxID=945747 RepID=A0A8J7DYI4_9CYAN|nr:Uma2 family endonuclease [Lusitaniella coriacea]MBE9116763.1 Uma2 family endonuclease [Lusitaniella coriacea LEGE 07157]